MSKRLGSPYRAGRSAHWLKIKNPDAPAARRLEKKIGIARDPSLSLVPLENVVPEVPALWRWCWSYKERGLLQGLNHLCLLQSPRTQRKGVAPRIVVEGHLAGFVVYNNPVRSTGQCNTACSLSAGVWKPKVFRGR